MNNHQKLFDCKYPIIEAGMNIGSQLELALAVSEAGAFPSLCIFPRREGDKTDFSPMFDGLKEFIKANGSPNVIVPIGAPLVTHRDFFTIAKDLKISHWDIFPRINDRRVCCSEMVDDPRIYAGFKALRQYSHILGRVYNVSDNPKMKVFSGLELKSLEGGGGRGKLSGKEFFEKQIAAMDHNLIPFGGIGSPEQVKYYIDHGAIAVGIGTMFAATVESPVSTASKERMVQATSSDIQFLPELGLNALLFDKSIIDRPPDDAGDLNRTEQLHRGVYGDGTQGLIYVGESIDYVDRIRTVKETVDHLVSLLK